jgi:hypothetical protein
VNLHGHLDCHESWVFGNANSTYIEGDVPILGLDHFVHTHILREKPDYFVSMLYGHKAI